MNLNTSTNTYGVKLRLSVYILLIFTTFLFYSCDNIPTDSFAVDDPDQNQDVTNPVPDTSAVEDTTSAGEPSDSTDSGNNPPGDGSGDEDPADTPSSSERGFVVFDGTNFRPKPSALANAGLEPIEIVYSTRMFDGRNNHDLKRENSTELPDQGTVEDLARNAAKVNDVAVIDIEHWELNTDRASVSEVEANIDRYMTVLEWYQNAAPETQFGYYGNVPIRSYFDAIAGPDASRYKDWMERNDRLTPLANQAEVLFPSLYTFYADRDLWVDYAVGMINEAKRYNPDQPVYVFLWPEYHPYEKSLAGKKIEGDFWKIQLETARKHADGIVIWAGGSFNWDPNDDWWQVTKEFMQNLQEEK